MKRVVLHIDRLVLRGVERGDAGALAAALRSALQERLADPAAASALAGLPSAALLRAPTVTLADGDAGAQGQSIGHVIGQSIGQQLVPGASP